MVGNRQDGLLDEASAQVIEQQAQSINVLNDQWHLGLGLCYYHSSSICSMQWLQSSTAVSARPPSATAVF